MLMFGWVADEESKVRKINAAFEQWLRRHDHEALVNSIQDANGPTIQEFLTAVIAPSAKRSNNEILESNARETNDELNRILAHIEAIPRDLEKLPQVIDTIDLPKPFVEEAGPIRVETQFLLPRHQILLAGVRAVKVGGYLLQGGSLEDRYDLVIVCQTEYDSVVCKWIVNAYQGQLQSAWPRVEPVVRAGTRAGAVALMGRSLSHNIGSHALYWMEHSSREGQHSHDSWSRFYRYLRERMELIHGIGMKLPLSPQTIFLKDLIKDFNENTELTSRLCKSEGISSIRVDLVPDDKNLQVAIPGGRFGMQAFHCILENIARDCAKYGGASDPMHMQIHVDYPEEIGCAADLVRVRVTDACGRATPREKKTEIQKALDDLQIANEDGTQIGRYWGIKERFIAAALLRGIRVEDQVFSEAESWNLNTSAPGKPRILSLAQNTDTLDWEFYLLQPKEVLVIGSVEVLACEGLEGWKISNNIDSIKKRVQQTAHKFTILLPETERDVEWMESNREYFPFRTFMGGTRVTRKSMAEGGFAWLDAEILERWIADPKNPGPQEALKNDLTRQWIMHLGRKQSLDSCFILLKKGPGWYRANWLPSHSSGDPFEELSHAERKDVSSLTRDSRCLGIFHHHWPLDFVGRFDKAQYWEAYGANDSTHLMIQDGLSLSLKYTLFESALTRIFIVDERIDKRADDSIGDPSAPQGTSIRDRFELMGITIHGKEYQGNSDSYGNLLHQWLEKAGKDHYHFISIHRGILEKLENNCGLPVRTVCAKLCEYTPNLFIHSARSGIDGLSGDSDHPDSVERPLHRGASHLGARYMALSNVSAWLDNGQTKWDVVNELSLVRRTA